MEPITNGVSPVIARTPAESPSDVQVRRNEAPVVSLDRDTTALWSGHPGRE